jgi:ABC-2 type transport system ATP-binding protein
VNAIELTGLTKRYGDRRGIDDVTLAVAAGSIVGFIGPNGAGKSTTIRTLLGLLRPDSGQATLFGVDAIARGPEARAAVGYVPGESHFYDDLRVADLLAYLGGFHAGDHARRRAELIERFAIEPDARATDLSLGNRRKVAIAAALQHRPRLVVLDEPTNGLDPLMQARLFELLAEEARAGTTVFFSSHVLSEVQAVCERVAVIRDGRIVVVDDVAALRARQLRRVTVIGGGAIEVAGISQREADGDETRFLFGGDVPALLAALAAAAPRDVRIEEPSLEEIFLELYRA